MGDEVAAAVMIEQTNNNQSAERNESIAPVSSVQSLQTELGEQTTHDEPNVVVTFNIDTSHVVPDHVTEPRISIKGSEVVNTSIEIVQGQESSNQTFPFDINRTEQANIPNCISTDTIETVGIDTLNQQSNTPSVINPNPGLSSPGGETNNGTLSPVSEPKSGLKVKTKRRGSAWTDDETDFLMEVWARHSDGGSSEEFPHNTPVYRLISKAMLEKGFDKSWEQCKTRIHTLKRAYKITEDEIKAGKTNIIYCKHYEHLRIIMGDDPITSPKVLSEHLALKRQDRETASKSAQNGTPIVVPPTPTPTPKRKLVSSEKSVKRQNSGNSEISQISPSSFSSLQIAPMTDDIVQTGAAAVSAQVWLPAVNVQPAAPITTTLGAPQQTVYMPPAQFHIPPPPPYQPPATPFPTIQHVIQQAPQRPQLQEINNNNILVKSEPVEDKKVTFTAPILNTSFKQATTLKSVNNNGNSTHSTKSTLQQKREELEKLKLNLEMRKLDMERNKLEMEERQRREERDHQYRMMQLLLFGLGQQNAANLIGHVTEQDLGHVADTITLSRAIENGLLPGGSLKANEKGLSFSEI